MGPILNDPPTIDNQDAVGVHDCLDPVGDYKSRPVLHQPAKRSSNFRLGFCVNGGGRIIQNQDPRILQERAGDRKPLFLAA